MDPVKAVVYLHSSKEQMYEIGTKIGLSGQALDLFLFACCEVRLEVLVHPLTGVATIVSVDERKVEA